MNRWHVYEFLKQTYMFSGQMPTYLELRQKFQKIDQHELFEGMKEFEGTIGERVPLWRKEASGT